MNSPLNAHGQTGHSLLGQITVDRQPAAAAGQQWLAAVVHVFDKRIVDVGGTRKNCQRTAIAVRFD